jgi:hypothetical protein
VGSVLDADVLDVSLVNRYMREEWRLPFSGGNCVARIYG